MFGCEDNGLFMGDLANGRQVLAFMGHFAAVRALQLGLVGEFLFSGDDEGRIIRWRLSTGQ